MSEFDGLNFQGAKPVTTELLEKDFTLAAVADRDEDGWSVSEDGDKIGSTDPAASRDSVTGIAYDAFGRTLVYPRDVFERWEQSLGTEAPKPKAEKKPVAKKKTTAKKK